MEQNFVSKEQLEAMVSKLDAIAWLQDFIPAEYHQVVMTAAKVTGVLVVTGIVATAGFKTGVFHNKRLNMKLSKIADNMLKEAKWLQKEIQSLKDDWIVLFRASRIEQQSEQLNSIKETLLTLKENGILSESQIKKYEEIFK